MFVCVMLIKIEHFPKKIRYKQDELRSYVIDYADYTGTYLEQMGVFRHREICECILGKLNAIKIKMLVLDRSTKKVFFCNERTFDVPKKIYEGVISHPELYAAVLFRCYS